MNNEQALKLIDTEIEKWSSRKILRDKLVLEGQVDELKNQVVSLEYQNEKLKNDLKRPVIQGYNPSQTLYDVERDFILNAIKFHDNKIEAAEALGITIKTLYNKLHEYGEFDNLR